MSTAQCDVCETSLSAFVPHGPLEAAVPDRWQPIEPGGESDFGAWARRFHRCSACGTVREVYLDRREREVSAGRPLPAWLLTALEVEAPLSRVLEAVDLAGQRGGEERRLALLVLPGFFEGARYDLQEAFSGLLDLALRRPVHRPRQLVALPSLLAVSLRAASEGARLEAMGLSRLAGDALVEPSEDARDPESERAQREELRRRIVAVGLASAHGGGRPDVFVVDDRLRAHLLEEAGIRDRRRV